VLIQELLSLFRLRHYRLDGSFGTLEFFEIGLNYSWISETIEDRPYSNGRYYLGVGNHFLKFPRTVVSIFFLDDLAGNSMLHGPALQSRTKDGLNVKLEISFQYKLNPDNLYDMYTTLGPTYEKTFIRMAVEQLTTAATLHNAHYFFVNRTHISEQMHKRLSDHFGEVGYAHIPFFQLRTVHLPHAFEDAIKETQVKQQEIKIATHKQETMTVTFETRVLQAEQYVKQLQNQADAEATAILLKNNAYCEQYTFAQEVQAEALKSLTTEAAWQSTQLLDYLRIRAAQEHPSNRTTMRF